MIRFRLAELISDAQFKSGRRVTLVDIAESTGINRMTLSRMANTRGYSTSTETIEKLCRFFGCQVGDVAQYIEDVPAPAEAPKRKASVPGKVNVEPVKKAALVRKKA